MIIVIVQDAYNIPADLVTRLATGELRRIGSVIRYAVGANKGQIVKHLKPVKLQKSEANKGMVVQAVDFVKQHKKYSIIVLAGAAAIVTGACVYNKVKNTEPKVVTEFRVALKVYIEAICKGCVDVNMIESLMKSLEVMKKHKDYENISIQLTTEELGVLVSRIYDYTVKLANDNSVELSEEELDTNKTVNVDAIYNLQAYLNAQKRIFGLAA